MQLDQRVWFCRSEAGSRKGPEQEKLENNGGRDTGAICAFVSLQFGAGTEVLWTEERSLLCVVLRWWRRQRESRAGTGEETTIVVQAHRPHNSTFCVMLCSAGSSVIWKKVCDVCQAASVGVRSGNLCFVLPLSLENVHFQIIPPKEQSQELAGDRTSDKVAEDSEAGKRENTSPVDKQKFAKTARENPLAEIAKAAWKERRVKKRKPAKKLQKSEDDAGSSGSSSSSDNESGGSSSDEESEGLDRKKLEESEGLDKEKKLEESEGLDKEKKLDATDPKSNLQEKPAETEETAKLLSEVVQPEEEEEQKEEEGEPDKLYHLIVLELKSFETAVLTSYLQFLNMAAEELGIETQPV